MIRTTLSLLLLAALGAQAQTPPPRPEGQRIDDRRPDQPFTVDLFGRPVELGGSWEATHEHRRNFDLNGPRQRDRRVRQHEVKLEARTRPTADSEVFVQLDGFHDSRRTQGTPGVAQRTKTLSRGQSWLKVSNIAGTGLALQGGRIALVERRSWWWDRDIDALRAVWTDGGLRVDTGVAKELARVASNERGVVGEERGLVRWFGHTAWRWAERQSLEAFWLLQNDRSGVPAATVTRSEAQDPSDLRARWLGLRAVSEWRPDDAGTRLIARADAALLRGRESATGFTDNGDGSFTPGATTSGAVRGHALDVGGTAILGLPLRPSLSVGYARGSDGFRQTGMQENKARFGGVRRLRTYGELMRPELANLSVFSLGGGIRILDNSSVEVMGFRFRQIVPSTEIRGSRLGVSPLGTNGDLGNEWDVVVAIREWRALELNLKLSRFTPGAAFADDRRDPAHGVEVGAVLNF